MRSARAAAACVVVLVAALSGLVHVRSSDGATASRVGGFFVSCGHALRSHDDPIARPGQPGASHEHEFYGSRATSANVTAVQMRHARTSCGEAGDTAGYWHPTLLVAGAPVTGRVNAYYDRGGLATVQPFPRDLKLLVGYPMGEHVAPASHVGFECVAPLPDGGLRPVTRPTTAVPQCRRPAQLAGRLSFPSCWNGRELDGGEHRDHLAWPRRGRCPAGFPIALPHLTLVATWPVRPDPATVALSSGVPSTWHGDFWNTWNPVRLRRLVRNCVDEQRDCGRVGVQPA